MSGKDLFTADEMLWEQPVCRWQVIGKSVRGASHIRNRRPNQDSICWWPPSGQGPPLMLAVADGHGSQRYLRSHIGSKLAVQAASAVLQELWREHGGSPSLSTVKRVAEERLPQVLVRAWEDRVRAHLVRRPVQRGEWQVLDCQAGAEICSQIAENPLLVYGTTLVATLLTDRFLLHLQLGDGDILAVAEDGEVSRPPLPGDERLLGNQTTSLCSPNAWREIRQCFQPLASRPPALILLSTDGYANSFAGEEAFRAVGSDLLTMIRTDGLAPVNRQLTDWLKATSTAGSGDDITLGLICRATGHT
jgi:hypothetical protein